MTRYITPYDALIINEWGVGGFTRPRMPSIRSATGAITEVSRLLLSAVPGSELVVDKLDEKRYAEQQDRIQNLGVLAVVDVLSLSRRKKERPKLDLILATLRDNKIFETGRFVGIHPVVHATAYKDRRRVLSYRAKILSDAIDEQKEGGKTLFDPKPIAVNDRQRNTADALYSAIDEATLALNDKIKDLMGIGELANAPSPISILVMSAGHIARALKGVTHDDIARSGVAVFGLTERLPKLNIWTPGYITLPSDTRQQEEEPYIPHVPELVSVPLVAQPNQSPVYAQ